MTQADMRLAQLSEHGYLTSEQCEAFVDMAIRQDPIELLLDTLNAHLPPNVMSAIRLGACGDYCVFRGPNGLRAGVDIWFEDEHWRILESSPQWDLLGAQLGWWKRHPKLGCSIPPRGLL